MVCHVWPTLQLEGMRGLFRAMLGATSEIVVAELRGARCALESRRGRCLCSRDHRLAPGFVCFWACRAPRPSAPGVAAVFLSANGTGTGVLVAFGGIVLVLALLGDRIESLEFGGTKLKLRAAAAEKFALAEDSENRGDSATAARLRAEAQALLDAAGPIAAEYRTVRGSMPSGPARTMAMERVVADARKLADEQAFDPAVVLRWLREGNDEGTCHRPRDDAGQAGIARRGFGIDCYQALADPVRAIPRPAPSRQNVG